MPPNLKLFPLSKFHEIEPLKINMEATTTGRDDQLWKSAPAINSIYKGRWKQLASAVASVLPREARLSASWNTETMKPWNHIVWKQCQQYKK